MSTPAYDGQGQPHGAQGWFAGLTAWWTALTPRYASRASGGISATLLSGDSSTPVTNGSPGAPSSAPRAPADSASAHLAASGSARSSAPAAVKP